jgi:predicted TIM-barrel fold metal-dependent hydrolase
MGVVDIHVHIQPNGCMHEPQERVIKHGRKDLADIARFNADPDAFVEHMDRCGIDVVGLINYPSQDVMGYERSVNEFGARYRDRHPKRFLAFGGVLPRFCKDVAAEMRWLLDDLRLDAIKVHPPHQLLAANAYTEGVPELRTIYAACEERGVPVMVHTGTSIFPGARCKFGRPMECDDVAIDFPRLPIILAHGGRPLWCDEAFFLLRRHENVWMDISGIPPRSLLRYFPRLEQVADKVLWGTDWPSPGVDDLTGNVAAFRALHLPEETKHKILRANALRLFPRLA